MEYYLLQITEKNVFTNFSRSCVIPVKILTAIK